MHTVARSQYGVPNELAARTTSGEEALDVRDGSHEARQDLVDEPHRRVSVGAEVHRSGEE
jgi:hypothetical protein